MRGQTEDVRMPETMKAVVVYAPARHDGLYAAPPARRAWFAGVGPHHFPLADLRAGAKLVLEGEALKVVFFP